MKIKLSKIVNIVLTVFIVAVVIAKIPAVYHHFKNQGSVAPDFSLSLRNGSEFKLSDNSSKKIIVFWATWCPPCEVELSRINDLIKDGKIKPESVLAISIAEEKSLVDKVVSERGYQFMVAYDIDGTTAAKFSVDGTPTIVFLNANKTIDWITAGLSPLLTVRVLNFFRP